MPQIQLSASKGLVQTSGVGFCDIDISSHSANIDLKAAGTAAQQGALVHVVTAASTIKLPTDSPLGQLKFIISNVAGNVVIVDSDNTAITTLNASQDVAICVKTASGWKCGQSLA